MKFEAYGDSPDFSNLISKFINENCQKLEEAKESGEQSINNYLLFQQYSEMIEKNLEGFLKEQKISQDSFYEALQFARDENLPCNFLDYILSSIEYEAFYYLMLDYKHMSTKEVNLDNINDIQKK